MSSLYRLWYFSLHTTVHIVGYLIPRVVTDWCRCIVSLVASSRRSVRHERGIRVVSAPHSTLAEKFGLEFLDSDRGNAVRTLAMRYGAPLYNCHISTLLGSLQPVARIPEMRREVIKSYDGNRICLDWVYPTHCDCKKIRAVVLLLPGLTGNSDASYIQRTAALLMVRGFAIVVLNTRGVKGTPLDIPRLYCALFTEDIRFVLSNQLSQEQLGERFECTGRRIPVVACGFSLGGMIVSHYVTEQGTRGEDSGLVAAITVTSPLNTFVGDAVINSNWLNHILYNYSMARLLRKTVLPHYSVLRDLPGVDTERVFHGSPTEKPLLDQMKSVRDFDDVVTGPHFGFANADEYYRSANIIDRLQHSATPMLCFSAADDPVCGAPVTAEYEAAAASHKAGLVMVEFPAGGHLGFLMSPLDALTRAPNPMEKVLVRAVDHFIESL